MRIAILEVLHDGEECVCHMEAALGFRQAYLSQQLAVLRESGIIQDRREGWNIFYRVVQPQVFDILDMAGSLMGLPAQSSDKRKPGRSCTCPKCAGQED